MKTAGLLKLHEITTCNLILRKLECRCLLCLLVYQADAASVPGRQPEIFILLFSFS